MIELIMTLLCLTVAAAALGIVVYKVKTVQDIQPDFEVAADQLTQVVEVDSLGGVGQITKEDEILA